MGFEEVPFSKKETVSAIGLKMIFDLLIKV